MTKYSKKEVIEKVKEELIKSYGSLSNGDLPYTVIGIVNSALK